MQDFKDLVVWQNAHKLALLIYKITAVFPNSEMFGLTSQIRRSAVSIFGDLMRYLSCSLIILSSFLAGCSSTHKTPEYKANWSKLQTGMSKQEVIRTLGEPSSKSTPSGVKADANLPKMKGEPINVDFFTNMFCEHWEYGKFGLFENLIFPSDSAYVVYFDANGNVISFREPLEWWQKGPYRFQDTSPTERTGGDFLESIANRKEGVICQNLKSPVLLYPQDHAVFCHFPRELVFRWQPASGTGQNAEYLVQIESTSKGNFEQFGSWTEEPPFFTYRTGKMSLNDRFCGAQPGRWRVKAIIKEGESPWSEWLYFRFSK